MKSKKTVFAAVLTLVLALSIVTVSATAASANVKKSGEPANGSCIAAAEASGECVGQPLKGFVKNLSFLTEQEKSALLADLAEIEKYENQINEIYSRMTDKNEKQLCEEIDTLDKKLTAVLERNAELWERVNDEYDEKIAANEPDMTFELNEADLAVCEKKQINHTHRAVSGRHGSVSVLGGIMKQLIYIAEDEKNIRETLRSFLENDGYEVCAFETGDALLGAFFKRRSDLVILDIMMPGTDGLTCCRLIREKDSVPIILLTAKDTEYDYVNGILQGGDDYLTKPFRPTVLLMRVKSLLRRVEMERGGDPTDRDIAVGDLRFSGDEKQLFCREKPLALSPNELKMLLFLMRGEGKAFSRDELLTHIWGYNDEVETRVTDETLRRIRSKLSSADSKVQIETVWGYGYRLRSDGGGK